MDYNLSDEINSLIKSKREGDYWDFKEKYYINKAKLLHDIICMSNNRVDRDAFIIFGIKDDNYEIVGIENDEYRKSQQNIIDLLKSKKFSSGIRPQIEMRTLKKKNHEIDVLIIKNSTDTPYFLIEDYRELGKVVHAYHIYTRVGDTNTDIDKSADINNIEYLWKKRFFLTKSPFEQIIKKLEYKKEWISDEEGYYNYYNPEFTIKIEDDRDDLIPEFYSYAMVNESTHYQIINVKYYGTRLFSRQSVILDGGRYSTTVPTWEFIHFGKYKTHPDYAFKYFFKNDPSYKLNEFLYDENDLEEIEARRRFFEVVLLFDNMQEKDIFIKYINIYKDDFKERLEELDGEYSWIQSNNKIKDEHTIIRLKTGKVLNQMLKEYRLSQLKYKMQER